MGISSVEYVTNIVWDELCEKVNKAVVFMDDAVAECLHWHGGLLRLLNAGALNVKEFSSFERGGEDDQKAVFVISRLITDTDCTDICRDILRSSHFKYTILITTISSELHQSLGVGPGSANVFAVCEERLAHWMGNMNYTAEVFHYPLFAASIGRDMFVTPSYYKLFPPLPTYIDSIRNAMALTAMKNRRADEGSSSNPAGGPNTMSDLTFSHLTDNMQVLVKMFVDNLNGLLERMQMKEECFALGDFSKIIATELVNLPQAKNRRKRGDNKLSLLLIDRTLDLCAVAGHGSDCVVDKLVHTLPRLTQHTTDCSVDMTPLLCGQDSTGGRHRESLSEVLLPGCLAQPGDSLATALLYKLITCKEKESLMELNRQLVDCASRENLSVKSKVGRITADFLSANLSQFAGNVGAMRRYVGVLQLGQAVVQAMGREDREGGEAYRRYHELRGVERLILQQHSPQHSPQHSSQHSPQHSQHSSQHSQHSPQHSPQHPLSQVAALMQDDKGFTLEDVLTLLIYVYSLNTDDCYEGSQEERGLQNILVQMVMNECNPEPLDATIKLLLGDDDINDVTVSKHVHSFFDKLNSLTETRCQLKQYSTLYSGEPVEYRPLVSQCMSTLFPPRGRPASSPTQDIQHISSGLTGMIKSGISYLMGSTRTVVSSISDNPVVLIYIVGGMTANECKIVTDTVTGYKQSPVQIIIGSSHISNGKDVLSQVITST